MSEFMKRLATAVVGLALLGLILYGGGIYLKLALLVLSSCMLWELQACLEKIDIHLNFFFLLGLNGVLFLDLLFFKDLRLGFLLSCLVILFKFVLDDQVSLQDLGLYFFAITYIPFFLYQLAFLDGSPWIYLVWVLSFGTDTFAYLVGVTLGRHKLIPKLSPHKSVEGAIGGVLGASLLAYLFCLYFHKPYSLAFASMVIFASVASQFGDLLASKIKRKTGIKDYSHILPGHGGFLDRFDSTLPVVAIVSIVLGYIA